MRHLFLSILLLAAFASAAQTDSTATHGKFHPYEKKSFLFTLGVGFADQYRTELRLPADFKNDQVTGFAPIFARLEYGLTKHISIACTAMYDNFYDNYDQLFYGNGETFNRFYTDDVRIFGGTVAGYYHLDKYIQVRNMDIFAGGGLSLNNIRHSSAPQTDSMSTIVFSHSLNLYLKVGMRYFLSAKTAVYADLGYEKQSILNIGLSYRFYKRSKIAALVPASK